MNEAIPQENIKYYEEIFQAISYDTIGYMDFSPIFNNYESALQYVNTMLKYHNRTYRIEKSFKQKEK